MLRSKRYFNCLVLLFTHTKIIPHMDSSVAFPVTRHHPTMNVETSRAARSLGWFACRGVGFQNNPIPIHHFMSHLCKFAWFYPFQSKHLLIFYVDCRKIRFGGTALVLEDQNPLDFLQFFWGYMIRTCRFVNKAKIPNYTQECFFFKYPKCPAYHPKWFPNSKHLGGVFPK